MLHTPIAGRDYELKLPTGSLSWSQIDTFLRCPEKYRRRYVEGGADSFSASLYQGSLLTSVLEWVGERVIKKKKHPLAQALKLHNKYVENGFPDRHRGSPTEPHHVSDWQDTSLEIVVKQNEIFLQLFYQKELQHYQPERVEWEFNLELAGVPVHSWVDVVERNFVWDFKTSGSGDFFLRPDESLQLALYCVAAERERCGYIIFDKKKLDVYQKRAVGLKDVVKTRAWVECVIGNIAKSISLGVYHPCNPADNPLCSVKWCQFWGNCRGSCV